MLALMRNEITVGRRSEDALASLLLTQRLAIVVSATVVLHEMCLASVRIEDAAVALSNR